jgi:hypothetical protein
MTTRTTTGTFTFANWEEKPLAGAETGPRIAHASVTNDFTGGITATATTCEYSIVYVTEKAGSFTGMQLFTGTVGGLAGSFAVEERGTFGEDGTVRCSFEVVPGSGDGALAGLSGEGSYVAVPGEPEVPYTFTYDEPGQAPA